MKHMEYDPANPAHAVIVDVMRQAVETFPQWSDKPPLDMPLNMRTGKVYSGVNRVLLYLTACIRGIGDMRFCTKRQVEYLGGELLHSAEPFVILKPHTIYDYCDVQKNNALSPQSNIVFHNKQYMQQYVRNTFHPVSIYNAAQTTLGDISTGVFSKCSPLVDLHAALAGGIKKLMGCINVCNPIGYFILFTKLAKATENIKLKSINS